MGELAHQLFERKAAAQPQAPALELGQRQLSYEALDSAANALAQRLRSDGVKPDTAVGLYADRSLEMLVGFFGILKAGGAVLPLDASYPPERLQLMVNDAGARIVVAAGSAPVPALGKHVIPIDLRDRAPNAGLDRDVTSEHAAYIIYTSGSTGVPNGVVVRHRGLSNLVAAMAAFGTRAGSRVLQLMSPGFDAFIQEIAMTLVYGATLVLVPPDALRPGAELVETLRAARINVLSAVPSLLALLPADELPDLETVCSGGEPLSRQLHASWSRAHTVFNAYGPTEATVCTTLGTDLLRSGKITIGRPIDNVEVYLLDDRLRRVETGTIGEIFIGGAGIARGYLGRAALTAERFVPDPFSAQTGARMYRTGDLASSLEDGTLVFVGRSDDQVKIRGNRVELEEVEHALRALPGIRGAAVVAREVNGSKALVAYVQGRDRNAKQLEAALAARLPGPLIPTLFVFVDAFPVAGSGKLDRQALLALPLPAATEGVQAASKLEQVLVAIWSDVLGLDAADVTANFFDLGGDSLRAAMVTNRLQYLLGATVYVITLLDHPTIRELAANLEDHYSEGIARMLGATAKSAARDPAPVTRADAEQLRGLIAGYSPLGRARAPDNAARNPRMIFVLSAPRSGSTLLRVMLAGHHRLFAPQELGLLAFETLGTAEVLANGLPWMSEALVRTLMEIKRWSVEQAKQYVSTCEHQRMSTKALFGLLQRWVAPRILVDKSTIYAIDALALARAEASFQDACYVHLTRHPCGMIHSFVQARLDQSFFRWPDKHLLSARQLGELVWQIANDNILTFLRGIPASRQCAMRYEDLVDDPRREMTRLCSTLGIDFEDGMTRPYDDVDTKMIDGIYRAPVSRQVGDAFFTTHTRIDPALAEAWRGKLSEDSLGERTLELARLFDDARATLVR